MCIFNSFWTNSSKFIIILEFQKIVRTIFVSPFCSSILMRECTTLRTPVWLIKPSVQPVLWTNQRCHPMGYEHWAYANIKWVSYDVCRVNYGCCKHGNPCNYLAQNDSSDTPETTHSSPTGCSFVFSCTVWSITLNNNWSVTTAQWHNNIQKICSGFFHTAGTLQQTFVNVSPCF